jgi:hypothetical protein
VNSLNKKKKSLSLSIHTHTSHIYKKIKAEKRLKLVGHIYRGARSSTEDNSLTTGRRFCGCFHDKLVKESRRARREDHATRKKNYSYRLSKRRSHMEQVNPYVLIENEGDGEKKKKQILTAQIKETRHFCFI